MSIDSKKHIQHLFNEKRTLMLFNSPWIIKLFNTFVDTESICFIFELLQIDLETVIQMSNQLFN